MSGKEEKRQRKEQKQQAAQRRALLLKWGVRSAAVVFVVLAVYVFSRGLFGGAPALAPDRMGELDHVRGNREAPLVLTVYADFECPSCRTEMQMINRAWPRIENDVALVFRHFPLDIHRHAFLAARYAEAAGRQDKFWEMSDLLFSNQRAWTGASDAPRIFDALAEQLGLDMEQLKTDLNSAQVRDKIVSDQRGGVRAGVRGTPSLFLNGRSVNTPRTAADLQQLIQEARD